MNQRSNFWLAAAGLLAAMLALGVGFVALVRVDDSASASGGDGTPVMTMPDGSTMPSDQMTVDGTHTMDDGSTMGDQDVP